MGRLVAWTAAGVVDGTLLPGSPSFLFSLSLLSSLAFLAALAGIQRSIGVNQTMPLRTTIRREPPLSGACAARQRRAHSAWRAARHGRTRGAGCAIQSISNIAATGKQNIAHAVTHLDVRRTRAATATCAGGAVMLARARRAAGAALRWGAFSPRTAFTTLPLQRAHHTLHACMKTVAWRRRGAITWRRQKQKKNLLACGALALATEKRRKGKGGMRAPRKMKKKKKAERRKENGDAAWRARHRHHQAMPAWLRILSNIISRLQCSHVFSSINRYLSVIIWAWRGRTSAGQMDRAAIDRRI